MQAAQKISVVIIDDHPLFQQGVVEVMRLQPDFEIVGVASTGKEGLALIRQLKPHIGVTDVNLPDLNGLMVVKAVTQEHLPTRMILLTAYSDVDQKVLAFLLGARGYCTKDIQPIDFVERVRAVMNDYFILIDEVLDYEALRKWLAWQTNEATRNEPSANFAQGARLSPREIEVLSLLAQGRSNKEIAQEMGISYQTVKNHLASLFRKLGVEDRTQAVVYALQRGWTRIPTSEKDDEG